MKATIFLLAVMLSAVACADNFLCTKLLAYEKNDCNTCVCFTLNGDNKLACTKEFCDESAERIQYCKRNPGKIWTRPNGSECVCTTEYGQVCTVPNIHHAV